MNSCIIERILYLCNYAKRRRPGALLEHRQSQQIFCLTHQGRFALVIRKNNFILACTLFLPGGEVFNEAESRNIQEKNPPQNPRRKKTASTVFDIRLMQSHREAPQQPPSRATNPRRSRLRVQPDQHNKCEKPKSTGP